MALMAAAGTAAAGLVTVGPAAPAAAAGTPAAELRLTRFAPLAAGPDDRVVVTGTARNLSRTTLRGAAVVMRLYPDALDRAGVIRWDRQGTTAAAGEQPPDGEVVGSVRLPVLAAGGSAAFRVVVPAGGTGLDAADAFGPRAVRLEARAGGRALAAMRTTVVWAPREVTAPTSLSILVPVTSNMPSTQAGQPTPDAASSFAPGGRLDRLLTAVQQRPVAWALDPAVLVAARRSAERDDDAGAAGAVDPGTAAPSGTAAPTTTATTSAVTSVTPPVTPPATPATPATSTPTAADREAPGVAARDWLERVQAQRRGRDVLALPYADPDLSAVLRTSKGLPLLRSADNLGASAARDALGADLDTSVAWPATGRISRSALANLASTGRTAIVLAAGAQPPRAAVDHTTGGRSSVPAGSRVLAGLLYDEELSGLLTAGPARSVQATQALLAQLAAITAEQAGEADQAGDGRHLLAVTPRSWDPDPAATRPMLAALAAAPWVRLRGLSQLRSSPPDPQARTSPAYGRGAAAGELPIGVVSGAVVLHRELTAFAPVLAQPAPLRVLRERVVSLLSVAWRQDRPGLTAARVGVTGDVETLVDGVQLRLGSDSYLLTAREGPIPVTVINTTPYPVTVQLRLRPRTGQLAFGEPRTVTVPPRTRLQVLPRARVIASGDVVVDGKLLSPVGTALEENQTFVVRVRPEWEGRGMIVAGSVLGLLLVVGLLRGGRRGRGRARIPIETVPDVDEEALDASERASTSASGPRIGAPPGAAGSPEPVTSPSPVVPPVIPPGPAVPPEAADAPEPAGPPEPDPKAAGGPGHPARARRGTTRHDTNRHDTNRQDTPHRGTTGVPAPRV